MIREIEELEWAQFVAEGPAHARERKLSGLPRKGQLFEQAFGNYLRMAPRPADTKLLCGQWIRFKDKNGFGHAQPDMILSSPRGLYIFECKLTENTKAWIQLYRLYTPLIKELFPGLPLRRVQVCKNLKGLSYAPKWPEPAVIASAKALGDHCIWQWDSDTFNRKMRYGKRR